MNSPGWFCVRTQQKQEHIAAAHLRRSIVELEVFSPRLRVRKATRRGAVWFVEALFPGYLFARFSVAGDFQLVRSTPGVKSIVAFGRITPMVPDEVISQLRSDFDKTDIQQVPEVITAGTEVLIAGGPFHGLSATVLRVLPAQERVHVLLNVLGGLVPVELHSEQVVKQKVDPIKS
jgi:transcriptional antiterminator RfaH